jgi:Zn finger protein HypA/HybF involved in hydrogenase expression
MMKSMNSTRLEVISTTKAQESVTVKCALCEKEFIWYAETILPNFCPHCGRQNAEILPRK